MLLTSSLLSNPIDFDTRYLLKNLPCNHPCRYFSLRSRRTRIRTLQQRIHTTSCTTFPLVHCKRMMMMAPYSSLLSQSTSVISCIAANYLIFYLKLAVIPDATRRRVVPCRFVLSSTFICYGHNSLYSMRIT